MITSLPCTNSLVQLFPFLSSDWLLISVFLHTFLPCQFTDPLSQHTLHPSRASFPALDPEPFLATIPVRVLRMGPCLLPPTDPLCLIHWDTPAADYSVYRCPCSLLKKPELCVSQELGENSGVSTEQSPAQTKTSKHIPTRSNIVLEVQHVDFCFIGFCHGKLVCIFLGCIDGKFLVWSRWSCQMSCSCSPFETTEPPSKLQGTNFLSVSLQCLKQ